MGVSAVSGASFARQLRLVQVDLTYCHVHLAGAKYVVTGMEMAKELAWLRHFQSEVEYAATRHRGSDTGFGSAVLTRTDVLCGWAYRVNAEDHWLRLISRIAA